MSNPDVTIVIPVWNRGERIRHTLESVNRASSSLDVEVIVVDDGSIPPVSNDIARLGYRVAKIIRHENQGLLYARLAGLAAASGRYLLFLDSDDMISSEKLCLQVAAMDSVDADVSYTDTARCVLQENDNSFSITADVPFEETSDSAEFFIGVQPAPHSPLFRTGYIQQVVTRALFPPSNLYNSVAEIWFYHNACVHPARIIKVKGPHSIIGLHPGARLTDHWEKLAVASLAVMEAFARVCPQTAETRHVRQLVAEKAFLSWRRLPRGFFPEFCERQLNIWRNLKSSDLPNGLGGRIFQRLALRIGIEPAGRIMRFVQAVHYSRTRTMTDTEFHSLLGAVPLP